jgi:peptide/nickel transport system permease protein
VVGAAALAMLICAATWGWLAPPHDPLDQDFAARLVPPGGAHWLGTDHFGRDVLARLLGGALVTLVIGTLSTAGACLLGIPLGIMSAGSNALGAVIARGLDAMQALPFLILALVLVTVLGASSGALVAALALGYAPYVGRVVEARVRLEATRDYVLAARAIGQHPSIVVLRHVLPNAASALLVQASEVFAGAILGEAALSYLGLGPGASTSTWGRMLFDARPYMEQAPHTAIAPLLAICVAVLGANLFGDGLRGALDPFAPPPTVRRQA